MKHNKIIFHGLKELKSIKSFDSIKILSQKLLNGVLGFDINFTYYTQVPPILQIEPTNHCNLNCISCPSSRCSRKKGYIDIKLYKKIIDDASQIGVKLIQLYCLGEPLLHPKIIEMIRYTKSKNLPISMATNGMLLNKEKSEDFLQSNLTSDDLLRFSIQAYSKEVHEKIMKGLEHDKVLENIKDFIKKREEIEAEGPRVETVFWTMPENIHEKKQFKRYWSEIVDSVKIWRSSESFRNFKKMESTPFQRKKTCFVLWNRLTVYWNGDVPICCLDTDGEHIVGNLNTQSIQEIWNSEQFSYLRSLHEEKQFQKYSLCSKCDYS